MSARKSWFGWLPTFLKSNSAPIRRSRMHRLNLEILESRTVPSVTTAHVAPTPSNDVQPTDGATPLVLDSLSYFSETDSVGVDPSSVMIVQAPTHGMATIDPSTGKITYIANAGFAGTDTIGFRVTDQSGLTSGAAYVNEVVTLPIANAATLSTESGISVRFDSQAMNSSAAAALDPTGTAIVGMPAHGSASVNSMTGAITYTPAATFSGTDSFTYTVKDMNGVASNPATVQVVVGRPQANNTSATTSTGMSVVVPVLSRSSGPSALMPSTVAVASGPASGMATVNPSTGAITYTPNTNFSGTDSFTYTVTDVQGVVSNAATVTVAVQKPVSGTAINPISTTTEKGVATTIDVLAVDSSPNGLNPATVLVASGPSHGMTSVNPTNGRITYTPTAGYVGLDSFTYSVRDNMNNVAGSATVSLTVGTPQANDGLGVISAGRSVVIPVLASDSDVNNPLVPSSVRIVTGPTHGTVMVDPMTGNVTYTANSSFTGIDTFSYTVANSIGVVSNPGTVTVQANGPTVNDAFGTTDSGHAISIDTLASATHPTGAAALVPSSVRIVSGPMNGSATIDTSTGMITYTSTFGFSGTDTIGFTVSDANGAVSNIGTLTIVVNRPTANPDSATTTINTPVSIPIAANDSDPDGNQHLVPGSVTLVSRPSHGFVSVGGGSATYSPAYNFVGTDSFTYTIADENGAVSNPATVTVTVTGSPAKPGPIVFLPVQPINGDPATTDPSTMYVDGLYRDILGRQADAAGVAGWLGQLGAGVDRATIARSFLMSSEHLTAEVTNYYLTFLGRDPDAGGLSSMVAGLQAGVGEQAVILGFVTSTEFLTKFGGSSTQFVDTLYSKVLGRTASADEMAYWTGRLDGSFFSQGQIAVRFVNSTELLSDLVGGIYVAILGRPVDSNGQAVYVAALVNGSLTTDGVTDILFASDEYAAAVSNGMR